MATPSEIQTSINNLTVSCDPIEFVLLATQTGNSNVGISFSVATIDNLPDLETNNIGSGQIIFVEDIGIPVVSTENEWKGLDGRLIRKDFISRKLFSWGSNTCGGLGDGTTISRCSPVQEISSSLNWCQVSDGACHTAAIKTSGELWAWGSNIAGALGNGAGGTTADTKCSPVREITSSTNWCQVSATIAQTAAIKTSGTLWTWGCNSFGQLGDGTIINRCSPIRERCSATDWCQVSAIYHTVAIKTTGELWAWGRNNCGQLGDGTVLNRCSPIRERCSATDWCQVSSGIAHTAAIKTSGELWVWGRNACGSLGDNTIIDKCSPVREISISVNWCSVSAGGVNTSAIKNSGELWSWGSNNCGILGDGTVTTRLSPVREISSSTDWCQTSAGTCFVVAVKTSGEVWAWGNNVCGQLGDGTVVSKCSPVREISRSTDWCQTSNTTLSVSAIKVL